jgi:hypothetical protein
VVSGFLRALAPPEVVGVRDGLPVLEDDRVLEVANGIWCTGYRPDPSWIDLPAFGGRENAKVPVHQRGVVADPRGLYFVGLFFHTRPRPRCFGGWEEMRCTSWNTSPGPTQLSALCKEAAMTTKHLSPEVDYLLRVRPAWKTADPRPLLAPGGKGRSPLPVAIT